MTKRSGQNGEAKDNQKVRFKPKTDSDQRKRPAEGAVYTIEHGQDGEALLIPNAAEGQRFSKKKRRANAIPLTGFSLNSMLMTLTIGALFPTTANASTTPEYITPWTHNEHFVNNFITTVDDVAYLIADPREHQTYINTVNKNEKAYSIGDTNITNGTQYPDEVEFVDDSACSAGGGVANNAALFLNLQMIDNLHPLKAANNQSIEVKGIGSILFQVVDTNGRTTEILIHGIRYCPTMKFNVLSHQSLKNDGYEYHEKFGDTRWTLPGSAGFTVKLKERNGLNYWQGKIPTTRSGHRVRLNHRSDQHDFSDTTAYCNAITDNHDELEGPATLTH